MFFVGNFGIFICSMYGLMTYCLLLGIQCERERKKNMETMKNITPMRFSIFSGEI